MNDYAHDEEEYRRREYAYQAQEWNKKVKKMYVHGKLANGVTLSYDTVFGINYEKIYKNLLNVGEGYIIFSVGTSIAIKDLQTKTTKFFTREHRMRYVTCLNAAHEKDDNILLTVGESTPSNEEKAAYVTIINTKENKWITMNTNMRAFIKEIIIETDKKYCAALVYQFQAAFPQILFWNYQKEKLIGQAPIRIPVEKISFYLTKPKQIILQTSTYLRVWELNTQEKTLKETHIQFLNLKKESGARVLDHCWLPHGNSPLLLILANNNIVHIVQNDVVKKEHLIDTTQMSLTGVVKNQEANADDLDEYLIGIDDKIEDESPLGDASPHTMQTATNMAAVTQGLEFNCIAPTKKGFILGGTKGIIGFYEIEKSLAITNALAYQCPNPEDCKVIFLSTNQSDSITSVVTTNISDGKFNYYLLNIFQIDSGTSPIQPFFSTGFHNMSITSMSVCRSRAILATSSDDGFVRIWNYFETEVDEKKGVISQYFKDMPLSVSLHPCSHFLAVAFGNCYKVFAILSDSLQALTTVNLTSCKIVKYTYGGHYLVVNERSNIILFDTIYYDALYVFDAHTSLIKDLVITEDDKTLISTCEGGFVFVWNLVKPETHFHKDWQHKNTMYNKILYDHENDLMYGCTGEKPICIFGNMCKDKIAEFITGNSDHDTRAAVLSLKHQVLFTGTNKGTIKVFLWPMKKENFELEAKTGSVGTFTYKFPDFIEYNAHLKPVTYLEVSYDGNYLFSGAADGSVFIFKITDVNFDYAESKKPAEKDEKKIGALANEIYLEKLSKIKEQNEHIKKLHFEVTKSQQTVKIELKKLEMMYKSKIDQINADFNNELQANSTKKELFMDKALKDYDVTFFDYETLKDKWGVDVLKTVELNKQKEEYEMWRNKEVENEIQRIKEQHQKRLSEMSIKHKKELEAIRSKYQQKCEQIQGKYNSVVDQAKSWGVSFLQRLEKNEEACEKENEEKTKELIHAIAQEKQINSQLLDINSKLALDNKGKREADTERQGTLDEAIAKNNKLKEENITHMAALLKMQEQLLEREEVILSKEETCKAARDEQINLENFRYLLDQKIKTLSNEKEGMLDKIGSQEKLLKDTFQELIRESGKNDDKHEQIKSMDTKIRVMESELKKVDLEIIQQRQRFSDMVNNVDKVLGTKEKEKWAGMLRDVLIRSRNAGNDKVILRRDLSDKEILEILKQSEDKAYDVNDELLKQAKWITKKLYLVNVTGRNLRDIKETSIQNILGQNGKLIEECNLLRSENENLTNKMKFLEKVVQDGYKKKRKLENPSTITTKQNRSTIKLEKLPRNETQEDSSTQYKSMLSKYSPSAANLTDNSMQARKQVQAFDERSKNLLGLKLSPDARKLLPEISPQKSSRGAAPNTQPFTVEEAVNEGERG